MTGNKNGTMVIRRRNDWWILMIPGVLLIALGLLFPEMEDPDRDRMGRIVFVTIGLVPLLAGLLLWLRHSYVLLDAHRRVLTHGWSLFGWTRLTVREITTEDSVSLSRREEGPRGREVEVFHITLDGSNDAILLTRERSLGEAHALAEEVAQLLRLPMADYTQGEVSRRTARALDIPFQDRVKRVQAGGLWHTVKRETDLPELPRGSKIRVREQGQGYVVAIGPNRLELHEALLVLFVTLLLVATAWWFVGAGTEVRIAAALVALGFLGATVRLLTLLGRRDSVSIQPDLVTIVQVAERRRTTIRLDPSEIEDVLLGLDGEFVVLRTDDGSVLLGRGIWMNAKDMRRLRTTLRAALRIVANRA